MNYPKFIVTIPKENALFYKGLRTQIVKADEDSGNKLL